MKKALVACLPDPSGNPRPNRVIHLLNELGYDVYSLSRKPEKNIDCLKGNFQLKSVPTTSLGRMVSRIIHYFIFIGGVFKFSQGYFEYLFSYLYNIRKYQDEIKKSNFEIIVVEDLNLLPFVFKIKGVKTKVVFDAREYYPKENDESSLFRFFIAPYRILLCKYYLPILDGFYTVSNGLAEMYSRDFKVKPEVIRSTPFFQDTPIENNPRIPYKMVHHGGASENRQLENMIEIVSQLEGKFTLDFYLTGNKVYENHLKTIAKDCPYINFCEPVPFKEIHKMLTSYDIGFCYMSTDVTNTMYSLPNKFFEYIQARLVLAINPAPDMTSIAREYNIAIISDDFSNDSMVTALRNFNKSHYLELKANIDSAANVLNWEVESQKLIQILKSLN